MEEKINNKIYKLTRIFKLYADMLFAHILYKLVAVYGLNNITMNLESWIQTRKYIKLRIKDETEQYKLKQTGWAQMIDKYQDRCMHFLDFRYTNFIYFNSLLQE